MDLPASELDHTMDYQWLDLMIRRDPEATGWVRVTREELPSVESDSDRFIAQRNLLLFKRPIVITDRVRSGEQKVAEDVRAKPSEGVKVAKPLSSPMGPLPKKRTMRGMWCFVLVWLHAHGFRFFRPERIVLRFTKINELGLRRWADENHVTVDEYVTLHIAAIREGRGRWPGQIIRGARR